MSSRWTWLWSCPPARRSRTFSRFLWVMFSWAQRHILAKLFVQCLRTLPLALRYIAAVYQLYQLNHTQTCRTFTNHGERSQRKPIPLPGRLIKTPPALIMFFNITNFGSARTTRKVFLLSLGASKVDAWDVASRWRWADMFFYTSSTVRQRTSTQREINR